MNKKYFVVLDTETANSVEQPLPYDIGYAIVDREGNIYEQRSFIIYEIYCQEKDLMRSAYYAEKIPNYEKDIKAGTRKIVGIWTARKTLLADMKKYNTKTVCAYNMNFDKRALNNDIRYISKSWARWFFPYSTEFQCIWHMACTCILNRKSFIRFAEENGFISEKGNIQTSAEVAYRYITKNPDFVESHTGLEDVIIETAIMAYCNKQHKKFEKKPYSACWRIVQRKRKELELKETFKKCAAVA